MLGKGQTDEQSRRAMHVAATLVSSAGSEGARRGSPMSTRWRRGRTDKQLRCFGAGRISTKEWRVRSEGRADKHERMEIYFLFEARSWGAVSGHRVTDGRQVLPFIRTYHWEGGQIHTFSCPIHYIVVHFSPSLILFLPIG